MILGLIGLPTAPNRVLTGSSGSDLRGKADYGIDSAPHIQKHAKMFEEPVASGRICSDFFQNCPEWSPGALGGIWGIIWGSGRVAQGWQKRKLSFARGCRQNLGASLVIPSRFLCCIQDATVHLLLCNVSPHHAYESVHYCPSDLRCRANTPI